MKIRTQTIFIAALTLLLIGHLYLLFASLNEWETVRLMLEEVAKFSNACKYTFIAWFISWIIDSL